MKLSVLLLLPILISAQEIPKNLQLKLKNVKSFKELADTVSIVYHPTSSAKHRVHTSRLNAIQTPVRINGASIFGAVTKSKMRVMAPHDEQQHVESDVDEVTREHMRVFDSIRQGNDTCKLQSVCVPIPVENENPLVVIYPRCYEVMRCVGSCCDSEETCHPHNTRDLIKPIVEMIYQGNDRFDISEMKNITMVEHISCSCRNCGPKVKQCAPGYALGPSCDCECANQNDKDACTGKFYVSSSTKFHLQSTEKGSSVDADTDSDGPSNTETHSHDSSSSSLPKLEAKTSMYDPYSLPSEAPLFEQAPSLSPFKDETPSSTHSQNHHKHRHAHRGKSILNT